jgi:cell wall-associated NlpC family hydrolase
MLRQTRILLPLLLAVALLSASAPIASSATAAVDHGDRTKHRAARKHHRVVHRRSLAARRHIRIIRKLARVKSERARVVGFARRFLGVPYVWGGTSPSGFDCSGFTRYVYAHFGVSLPHYTYSQFDRGRRVARAALRPGDLVFFDGVGHVGLYIGHNLFIHAPHTGTRVSVASLSGWYSGTFAGARRLIS